MAYSAIGWAAWYDGNKFYKGDAITDWKLLPADGVVVIMVYFDNGTRRIMYGNDYYFFAKDAQGAPIYAQTDDLPAAILERYPDAQIKRGRWVSDNYMKAREEMAMAALDWSKI